MRYEIGGITVRGGAYMLGKTLASHRKLRKSWLFIRTQAFTRLTAVYPEEQTRQVRSKGVDVSEAWGEVIGGIFKCVWSNHVKAYI